MFRYNYIMIDQKSGKQLDDDEGFRRVADLKSIASHDYNQFTSYNANGYLVQRVGTCLHVDILDHWQTMKVKFSVLHTRLLPTQSLRITGSLPELGNWNKVNPQKLYEESSHTFQELVCYTTHIEIKIPEKVDSFGFNYSYGLFTENKQPEWERDPARHLQILSSDGYTGQLGNTNSFQFTNTDKCYFVNGVVYKNDGIFHKNFQLAQIGNLNIFMGPYPYKTTEINELRRKGINAILNIQTFDEMNMMGVDWSQ